jgi:protein-S-isoprenylcysteine O-methyltransferase Ste14
MATTSENPTRITPEMKKSILTRQRQVFIGTTLFGIFLFLGAGTLDWTMGWVYMGLNYLGLIINVIVLVSKNPELVAERATITREGTTKFDRIFAAIYGPWLFVIMAVTGMDAVRYGWSTVPTWVQYASIALFIFGWGFTLWAMVSNKHFETTVRIQTERGHKTITSGPYGIVRHPGYVGILLVYAITPTILGSWWGLIPAGLLCIGFIMRTAMEDKTLHEELPDYPAYAEKVRYRLLPGVW